MPLPRIAIATGDPAGIGPEIALKAALDARVRAACRPLLVGDPAAVEMHAKAAGLAPRLQCDRRSRPTPIGRTARSICSTPRGQQRAGRIRQGRRRLRPRLARRRPPRHQGGARRRGRSGGGGAADRALDRRRRHRLRRLSVVRRARDRHAGRRRLSDDLLRRLAHRARDLACERARGARADHARARRPRHPRHRRRAQEARHRASRRFSSSGLNPHAGEEGMFGSRGNRDHRAGDSDAAGQRHRRSRARSAPTPCSAKKAATPSS